MASHDASSSQGRGFQTILEDIRKSVSSLQQPADLIILMTYCIGIFAPVRICIEGGVFRTLAASKKPISASELAKNLKGVPEPDTEQEAVQREEYLSRMLRAVCGINLADEVGSSVYLANDLTKTMADPGFEAGFIFLYDDAMGPSSTMSHMVSWARDNEYKAPTTSVDGAFQRARGTVGTTTFHHWVKTEPASIANLSLLMKRIQQDRLNWSAWFPADVLFDSSASGQSSGDDGVFMVDVGGSLGHDLTAFASRYPDMKMRLVIQDLLEVIQDAKAQDLDPRIELSEHDFFQPEQIKGAKIYFMHKILHDWPDKEASQILSHLRDAMSSDSRIFINDVILPDQGSPLLMTAFDITMLSELSAKERSESMWERLISGVGGLAIRKFWQAPEMKGEGIVEVGKTP